MSLAVKIRSLLYLLLLSIAFVSSSGFAQTSIPTDEASPDLVFSEVFEEDQAAFQKLRKFIPDWTLSGIEGDFKNRQILYKEVVAKDSKDQIFYIVDIKGSAPANILADDIYRRWKYLIAISPSLPKGVAGAFGGTNGTTLRGYLLLSAIDPETSFHELLHGYLTHLEYEGVAHRFSGYFFHDPTSKPLPSRYASYFSVQEFATYLTQGLAYPKSRGMKSVNELLELSHIVRGYKYNFVSIPGLLYKKHPSKNMDLIGIAVQDGGYYVPQKELEIAGIAPDQAYAYIEKKLNATYDFAKSVQATLNSQGISQSQLPPANVDYAQVLENVKSSSYAADFLQSDGILAPYIQWSQLVINLGK